jgi:hypothetical protein
MERKGGLCAALSFGESEMTPLFPMGRLVATPGAIAFCDQHMISMIALVRRHLRGDWGDLCDDDKKANDLALLHGSRILSAYVFTHGKVWIITEWDRSATTVLLPSEY